MRLVSLLTGLPGRLIDKTLHHHTWLVLRPLFDTPVLILLQSARKTSLDKLILRPCCGCCVAISILKLGVKGGRERWCKVLSINRHILRLGHNFGMRANMGGGFLVVGAHRARNVVLGFKHGTPLTGLDQVLLLIYD